MCRIIVFSFLVFSLTHCATHYDRDKSDPGYHKGNRILLPQTRGEVQSSPPVNQLPTHPVVGGAEEGIFLGTIAAISVAANPGYYKSSAISGKCQHFSQQQGGIDIPCVNITVLLMDRKGKELTRAQIENGEFAFYVKKGEDYQVSVDSRKYKLQSGSFLPARMGDNLILRLVPKN